MRELEDLKWWPAFLRNFQTDFVGSISVFLKTYKPVRKYWSEINYTPSQITDLCSGSGLPAEYIVRDPSINTELILTDKFPRFTTRNHGVMYVPRSCDVLRMKFSKQNCYTMFNAFHHFDDNEKMKIVTRMNNAGCRAYITEALEPTPICAIKVLLATTIGCVLFTPFVQPFSLSRLFFTYILPVNILSIAWDGLISVAKSRTVEHYAQLFKTYGDRVRVIRLGNCLQRLVLIEVVPDENANSNLEIQQAPHDHREFREHRVAVYHS